MWQTTRPAGRPAESDQARYNRLKADVHRTLVDALDPSRLHLWGEERVRAEVRGLADSVASDTGYVLPPPVRDRLAAELFDEVFGLGPLQPLLADPTVTEILVNGPDQVYVERDGQLLPTGLAFADRPHLLRIVQRIAARVGRRIDESSPMVDARLPDGSRVNAVVPPIVAEGPVLSVRRFPRPFTPDDLLALGTVSPELLTFLQAAVAARVNVLISGGSGAGKTTLLNALSAYIPSGQRVVTVEDTLELKLQQPHVVRMETRPANMEGAGEVTARDLVRNALRMRPDRIIVGECRGGEAVDMLQAMNTGHQGSLTTVHANDTRDALHRLEMMVGMAGFDVPVEVLRSYIAGAIELIVQVTRLPGGRRQVIKVSELVGVRKGRQYALRHLFRFVQTGLDPQNPTGKVVVTGRVPRLLARITAAGLDLPRDLFTGLSSDVTAREDARRG